MKKRSSKVCKETSDTLTLGTENEAQAKRGAFHLERCDDCQQDEQIVAAMHETVLSADDQLDDLTRARVGDKLVASMEQAAAKAGASSGARPLWRRRGAQLVAVAAGVALVAGMLLWQASWRSVEAPRLSPVAKDQPANRVLLPRAIMQGSGPWHDPKLVFGQKVERLEVPAGVALRASLTARAELTLYGPLELVVKQAAGDRIELQLYSGILIGEYKGSPGSSLVIRSPGAVTEIVGTLFAVEAHEGQSRVSVSRGKVRVDSAGKSTAVSGRQSWSTARASLGSTPPSVVALFAKHERLPELAQVSADEPTDRSLETRGAAMATKAPKTARPAATRKVHTGKVASVATAPDSPERPAASTAVEKPTASPDQPATPSQPEQPKTAEQPASQPPAPALESASTLYSAAEAALRRRDHQKAGQILSALIKGHPGHALADSARYELALLLLKRGERAQAETLLSQIKSTARFAGPAHYLRCRIKREQGKRAAAIACYSAFRSAYPASPYAYQALVTLMRLASEHKDCKRVKKLTGEYLSDYDFGKHVEEARRLRAGCEK